MMKKILLLLSFIGILFLTSCKKDDFSIQPSHTSQVINISKSNDSSAFTGIILDHLIVNSKIVNYHKLILPNAMSKQVVTLEITATGNDKVNSKGYSTKIYTTFGYNGNTPVEIGKTIKTYEVSDFKKNTFSVDVKYLNEPGGCFITIKNITNGDVNTILDIKITGEVKL